MNKIKQSSFTFEEEINNYHNDGGSKDNFDQIDLIFKKSSGNNVLKLQKEKNEKIFCKFIEMLNYKKIKCVNDIKNKKIIAEVTDKFSYEYLSMSIDFLTEKITEIPPNNCKRLIDLVTELRLSQDEIQTLIINRILPMIKKDNVVDFILAFYDRNSSSGYSSLIISSSIDLVSQNLNFAISNGYLRLLPPKISEIIFEKYFENSKQNFENDSLIISELMNLRGVKDDIYELLECEHKNSKEKFSKLVDEGIKPSLSWPISVSEANSFKESEAFFIIDNLISVILISYYDSNSDEYSIGIKINNDNSICEENNTNIINETNNFILSFLTVCEIPELQFKSKINYVCVFSNCKTKVLICKIQKFSTKCSVKTTPFNFEFTFNIYTFISYNFSSILSYICKNFSSNGFNTLPSISTVSNKILNIILKNTELTVNSEDDVVIAVMKWLVNKQVKGEILLEIMKNINWTCVSVGKIVEFTMLENRNVIENDDIRNMLTKALDDRSVSCNRSLTTIENNTTIDIKRNYVMNNNISTSVVNGSTSLIEEIVLNIAKVSEKNSLIKEQYNTNYSNNSNSNIVNTNPHYTLTAANMGYQRNNTTVVKSVNNPRRKSNIVEPTGSSINRNKLNTLSSQSPVIHSPKSIVGGIYQNNNIRNVNVASPRFNNNASTSKGKSTNKTQGVTKGLSPSPPGNRNRYIHHAALNPGKEKEVKSKSLVSERKIISGNTTNKNGLSGYPSYVKNINHFKSKSSSKNHLDSKMIPGKKKIPNFIEIAKRESRESKKVVSPPNNNQKKSNINNNNQTISFNNNSKSHFINPRAKSVI